MKRLFYFGAMLLMVLTALSSCDENKNAGNEEDTALSAPELTVAEQTSDSFVITWNAVPHASYYACRVNGEEQATSQPRLERTGLEPGSYTVEVMARPIPESGYADSEWATVTVTLQIDVDWFDVEPFLKNDDIFNYYTYNSVYMRFSGHDVASVKMDVMTRSDMEMLEPDEIVNFLTRTMTAEGIAVLNSTGELEQGVNNLQPDTEYVVAAYATHVSGIDTLIVCDPIKTDPIPDPPEGLEEWIGSYTVTSTHTLQLTAQGSTPVYTLIEEPMTFDITIEPSPNDVKTLYVYGWSILEDQLQTRLPGMAQLSDDGRKGLRMVQGYVSYNGYTLYWMPICHRSDDTYQMLTITDGIFTLYNEDGKITASMYSGTSSGVDYDVVAYDLFMMSGVTVNIPHEVPANFPAGGFTLEKVETPEQVFSEEGENVPVLTVQPTVNF